MASFERDGSVQRCMDRGKFALQHAWPWSEAIGGRIEYWRGLEGNGAVVFKRSESGSLIRGQWFKFAGEALSDLVRNGYYVPGVGPMEPRVEPVF